MFKTLTNLCLLLAAINLLVSGTTLPANCAVKSGNYMHDDSEICEGSMTYRAHVKIRNRIASRLEHLWSEERKINGERDRRGRSGDMVSVIQLESELLGVRHEIDHLRQELSLVNGLLAHLN